VLLFSAVSTTSGGGWSVRGWAEWLLAQQEAIGWWLSALAGPSQCGGSCRLIEPSHSCWEASHTCYALSRDRRWTSRSCRAVPDYSRQQWSDNDDGLSALTSPASWRCPSSTGAGLAVRHAASTQIFDVEEISGSTCSSTAGLHRHGVLLLRSRCRTAAGWSAVPLH